MVRWAGIDQVSVIVAHGKLSTLSGSRFPMNMVFFISPPTSPAELVPGFQNSIYCPELQMLISQLLSDQFLYKKIEIHLKSESASIYCIKIGV